MSKENHPADTAPAPAFSVVIPVYNAQGKLRRCVDSILSQTCSDLECILVNDGSTDASPALCEEFAAADRRVRVLHQKNQGVSAARNTGLQAARGSWVWFVDSDDAVSPVTLQFLSEAMSRFPEDFLGWRYTEQIDELPVSLLTPPPREILTNYRYFNANQLCDYFLTYCLCSVWCKLFDRKLLLEAGIRFDTSMTFGEDFCFVLAYLKARYQKSPGMRSVFFEAPLYFYDTQDNPGSIMHTYRQSHIKDFSCMFCAFLDTCSLFGAPDEQLEMILLKHIPYGFTVSLHDVLEHEGPGGRAEALCRQMLALPTVERLLRQLRTYDRVPAWFLPILSQGADGIPRAYQALRTWERRQARRLRIRQYFFAFAALPGRLLRRLAGGKAPDQTP